jgi:hypothetical protein
VRGGRDILPYRGANLIAEEQMQEVQTWDLRSLHPFGEIFAHPFLFLIVFFFLFLPAAGRILRRTGHDPLWCVLALFPVLNLGAFWFFAFKSWPTDNKPTN